jgi:hypothetical protein
MRPYYVAIVGSGPSGFFAAASLLKLTDQSDDLDARVDRLEMLPTPWGLVRSGVAPITRRSRPSARPSSRPRKTLASGSSAMSRSVSTCRRPSSRSATTMSVRDRASTRR